MLAVSRKDPSTSPVAVKKIAIEASTCAINTAEGK